MPEHLTIEGNPNEGWVFVRRLIAATNEELQEMIDEFKFWESFVIIDGGDSSG